MNLKNYHHPLQKELIVHMSVTTMTVTHSKTCDVGTCT